MLGTITRVFIEVLRKFKPWPEKHILGNVIPPNVILNNEYEAVVNTPLPFIGVFVTSSSATDYGYIGDLQGFNCVVQIVVITPFDNPAATKDTDIQYDYINLSGETLKYLALADKRGEFKELVDKYGFSFSFQGIDADQPRYKTQKQNYEVVQHTLIYHGKGFLLDLDKELNPTAPILDVNMVCDFHLVPSDELPPHDPNRARTYDLKNKTSGIRD